MKDQLTKTRITFKNLNSFTGRDSDFHDYMIVNFLHNNLEEFTDPKEDILRCLDYVYAKHERKGGFILLAINEYENDIMGCLVMNETNMSGYIPENVLVYIAVDPKYRGNGVAKQMIEHSKKIAKGGIALHVEPQNPAIDIFEKLGFSFKYQEMRFER